MVFGLLLEVLFSFPLRYLYAIGYPLWYLALDDQHHPYSVSTYKLAYSQERAVGPGVAAVRSRETPCAPRGHLEYYG